jgi:branched-chain amino acid transport system permease protein
MVTVALQQTINGVVFGSLYVLVALGLTLIYGVLVQINFAHADVVTIGAFAAYFFTFAFGGNYLISIGVALMVGAALGWLVNAAIFAPLRERGSELLPLIATIGVSILLQNAMLLWFGPIPYAFDSPYSNEVIRLWGGTFITWQNVIIVVVSTLTIVLLYGFMRFTITGKALRAVAQDRETAGLMGINPDHLIMLTFVLASALAGMSGAMLGPILVLTPFAGTTVIVKAFAIVIIGGFGNVEGTIIAGVAVGLIESYTTQLINPGLTDIVVFTLLLLMLALRPTGLIAEKREENV